MSLPKVKMSFTVDRNSVLNVKDSLGRFRSRIKLYGDNLASSIVKTYLREYIAEIQRQGLEDTKKLVNSLKHRRHIENSDTKGYEILIPKYGYFLVYMQPHYVSTRDRPKFQHWAKKKLGFVPGAIKVHPHDWITPANQRARRKVVEMVKDYMGKVI